MSNILNGAVVANVLQLTIVVTTVPAGAQYAGKIALDPATGGVYAKGSTTAVVGTVSGGVPLTADGAVVTKGAAGASMAGLGLPLTSDGFVAVSVGPAVIFADGLPFAADGSLVVNVVPL